MLSFLMLCETARGGRFYRVEVADNLYGEYTVLREWGRRGCRGACRLAWFSNLRDACLAAERGLRRAERRGFRAEGGRSA